MNLASYARRLTAAITAKDRTALQELCLDIEGDQAEHEYWPQGVFAFFIDALQDEDVCTVPGSSSLVMSLYDEFEKLTGVQRSALLGVLDENADEFADEMLRHSASDLIARKYPPPVAVKKFTEWMRQGTPRRLHMAQVGFEVLVMARKLEAPDETKVRGYLDKLWQRKD